MFIHVIQRSETVWSATFRLLFQNDGHEITVAYPRTGIFARKISADCGDKPTRSDPSSTACSSTTSGGASSGAVPPQEEEERRGCRNDRHQAISAKDELFVGIGNK